VPFYDTVASIKITDNKMKVTTKRSRTISLLFSKAIIFDEEGIAGIEVPRKQKKRKYEVLDWFNVRSGMCHKCEVIESDTDFVQRIHFYPSDRIDGNENKKDLVSISTMTEDQLHDVEHSEVYVKFKTLHLMKEAGITGSKNGTDDRGNAKYRPIKIESAKREVRNITRSRYDNTEYLTFNYDQYSEKEWSKVPKI